MTSPEKPGTEAPASRVAGPESDPAGARASTRTADGVSTSPYVPELRATTLGMVALIALGAFEALAVTTAMPTVVADLGGFELYATAFAGPVASSVVGLTIAGRWSDRRSPVAPLLTGVALFVVGLVVAGLAGSMLALVAGRVVQGVGSGLYSVVLYVVVARVYPEAARPRVFAAFAAAWVVPGMVGPYVAGLMVEHLGWRWVFLAVPLLAVPAVLALWPSLASMRGGPPARDEVPTGAAPAGPDADGAATDSTLGDGARTGATGTDDAADTRTRARSPHVVALSVVAATGVLALHHAGQETGGQALLWTLAGGAAVALTLPRMLPLGTLRAARGLPTVMAVRGLVSAAFFAAEVFLPLLLQTHRDLSPSAAGAVLTCAALSWSSGSWLRGRGFGGWSDVRWLRVGATGIVVGTLVAGLVVLPATPLVLAYVGWAVAGLGMGLAFPTLSLLTLRLSTPAEQGANSSALQVMDSVSVALVLALSGALLTALGGPQDLRAFAAGFTLAASVAAVAVAVAHRTEPRRR